MSEELSFAELDGQHVELLPARTVMSMISMHGGFRCHRDCGDSHGGDGGSGSGGIGVNLLNINVLGNQVNSAGDGFGGRGGSVFR